MDEIGTLYGAGLPIEAVWGDWEANLEVNQDITPNRVRPTVFVNPRTGCHDRQRDRSPEKTFDV